MLILNYSHPLTAEQVHQLEEIAGEAVEEVRNIETRLDAGKALEGQLVALADGAGLSASEWQTRRLLVVPPALSFAAVGLLVELHGRMGYFPPVVRVRPGEGAVPPKFEVAEVMDLQGMRDRARERRGRG